MQKSVHIKLLETLQVPVSATPHFHMIAKMFGVTFDTVYSIYSQEVQAKVIKAHHILKTAIPELVQRYLSGEELLSICFEIDMPPCIVLRRFLEQIPLGLPKTKITDILRHPSLLSSSVQPKIIAETLTTAGRHVTPDTPTQFISLLQQDIENCVACDTVYSPTSDNARHSAGLEYEAKLYNGLKTLGIPFWTEDILRSQGFHKTPDARLQVPIAIQGHMVCWIDSKATFGDERMHRQQMKEQYQRYVNRFGPGLVVYWHGYIADLQEESEGVLIMDRMPIKEEVYKLPQLEVEGVWSDEKHSSQFLGGERLKDNLLSSDASI